MRTLRSASMSVALHAAHSVHSCECLHTANLSPSFTARAILRQARPRRGRLRLAPLLPLLLRHRATAAAPGDLTVGVVVVFRVF